MPNSRDSQDHKDKDFDTSRKFLSQTSSVTRNTHVKHQSARTHYSNLINIVKVK